MFKVFCFVIALLSVSIDICAQTEGLKGALGTLQKPAANKDSLDKKVGGTVQVNLPDSTVNPQANNEKGNVVFYADSSIIELEKSKRGFKEIRGYRVQLVIGTADLVKKERNNFLSLGLPYSAYLKQIVPEYALQVGDFSSRIEMEKNLEIIRKYYPKAFPVVEVIEPPKFGKR